MSIEITDDGDVLLGNLSLKVLEEKIKEITKLGNEVKELKKEVKKLKENKQEESNEKYKQ